MEKKQALSLAEQEKSLKPRRRYGYAKANELIKTTAYHLSKIQQDILNYVLVTIKPDDKEFKPVDIVVQDYCRTMGIAEDDNYKLIREAVKGLADTSVWFVNVNGDGEFEERTWRWIKEPIATPGKFTVELQDYWAPYLLNLGNIKKESEGYTVFTLEETVPMKSIYGRRTYELLKSYKKNRTGVMIITFTVEEYRKIILAKGKKGKEKEEYYKTKYKDFSNFRRKVLDKAIEDVNEYGDIKVTYKLRKEGYSYRYIDFVVEDKTLEEKMLAWAKQEIYFSERKKQKENI